MLLDMPTQPVVGRAYPELPNSTVHARAAAPCVLQTAVLMLHLPEVLMACELAGLSSCDCACVGLYV